MPCKPLPANAPPGSQVIWSRGKKPKKSPPETHRARDQGKKQGASLELTTAQARRLRVLQDKPPGTLLVHEIYASIQGESTFAGLPCVFVRLTGCHLRCVWCDTPHAFQEGHCLTIARVLESVLALAPRLVEVTGGEPLAQPECLPLLTALANTGRQVLLETSGAWSLAGVDPRVTMIVDLKCPGSGEAGANRFEELARLKPRDELKFVIRDRPDFDWAVEKVEQYQLWEHPLLIAPVFGSLDPATLCEWILASGLPWRFQPQLHKQIWAPAARGV